MNYIVKAILIKLIVVLALNLVFLVISVIVYVKQSLRLSCILYAKHHQLCCFFDYCNSCLLAFALANNQFRSIEPLELELETVFRVEAHCL